MRSIPFGLARLALVLGLGVVAWGEDGSEDKLSKLEKQVELLEAQVAYLGARETALTTYILATEQRSAGLRNKLARSRAEGFTMAAFSAPSRELLLGGLEGYASDIGRDLPALTDEEAQLLRKVQLLQRKR